MKALFLFPYPPGESPSQRFRFEQYLEKLKSSGIEFDLRPFWSKKAWASLYQKGSYYNKITGFVSGLVNRFLVLFTLSGHQFVFIHRETLPLGPPVMEWLFWAMFRKKIIYDFDDAIWLPNTSHENRIVSSFKGHAKVKSICRWSYKISCGNAYLANYAKQFNDSVFINPTTVDTEFLHNPDRYQISKSENTITLGWTGTHSTLKYLDRLTPIFQRLEAEYSQIRFRVISNKKPEFTLRSLTFVPWSKETEIEDLLQLDIGLMPLADDIWANGKCGFKALQYMSLAIPAVASRVGVNGEIIDHGVNGYLCSTDEEWFSNLKRLIDQPELRHGMGLRGRQTVIDRYSVSSNTSTFLSLFE
jgi:glycosyltransferase involved in cell wall biosynthesis